MGCGGSTEKQPSKREELVLSTKVKTDASLPRANKKDEVQSKIVDVPVTPRRKKFEALSIGTTIYCLDKFNSKFNGEPMARWRLATISATREETSEYLVHFDGWKEKHDIWLTLPIDMNRLAPSQILSDDQKTTGLPLSVSQLDIVYRYLESGVVDSTLPSETFCPETYPPLTELSLGQMVKYNSI